MVYKLKLDWQYKKNYWFCPGVNIYSEDSIIRIDLKGFSNIVKISNKELLQTIKIFLEVIGEKETVFFEQRQKKTFLVFKISRPRIGKIIFEQALEVIENNKKLDNKLKSLIRKEWYKQSLNASAAIMYKRAKELNIPVWRYDDKHLLSVGNGEKTKMLRGSRSTLLSSVGTTIANKKSLTREILSKMGLPVAKGGIINSVSQGVSLAKNIGFPLVIKPVSGSHGKGVIVGIEEEKQLVQYLQQAFEKEDKLILEKQVKGDDYRILVIDFKFVAATKRIPANVIGNGKNTIRELVKKENNNPLRGKGHSKPLTKIEINQEVKRILQSKGKSLDYTPKKKEQVFLRKNANLSTGGEGIDVTDKISEENIAILERAARVTDLKTAGIDVITQDIGKSLYNSGAILELNASPGLRMHHYPSEGRTHDVAGRIYNMLFPNNNSRIPLIAVTGTNGKTTVTKFLAHILQESYDYVGWTTNAGAGINEKTVFKRIGCGAAGVRAVLQDKKTQTAVLETTQNTIWSGGLGFDWANVSIVTNLGVDHANTVYADSVEAVLKNKSLIVERTFTNGRVVLNADDKNTRKLSQKHEKIIWFSSKPEKSFVKKLIEEKKTVFCLQNEWIVKYQKENKERIIKAAEIPMSFNGKAVFNIENCMAAIAALWENQDFSISKDQIIEALKTFRINKQNPGRMNEFKVGSKTVILDYAHNSSGYRKVNDYLKRIKEQYSELVIVSRVAGDRLRKQIKEISEIIAESADKIYVKEPVKHMLRGAELGKITNIFKEELIKLNYPEKNINIVTDEIEANKRAVQEAEENALVFISLESTVLNMKEVLRKGEKPVFKKEEKNKKF